MARFIKKIIVYSIFIFLFCATIFAYIDPYNVYHWRNIRDNGIEPNKNYIKTKYLINNPDKFDTYILGSSRVGAIHVEKMNNCKAYNMTYSQANFEEELETLEVLINKNVNISSVYIGVDNASFCDSTSNDTHSMSPMHCSYKQSLNPLRFFWVYMNPSTCIKSLFVHDNVNEGFNTFYQYGWDIDYSRSTNYDWSSITPIHSENYDLDWSLVCIRRVKELCDQNNIRLIVFTNPMYEDTYKLAVDYNEYYEFLYQLALITEYYNYSGINDITTNEDNYIDWSHYRAEIGDIIIGGMNGEEIAGNLKQQGFGWLVSQDNIDELLEVLEGQYK